MKTVVTKDGSKTVVTKSSGKTVILYEESYTYQGVLNIWNGSTWEPRPEFIFQSPYTARPTYAYYNGQWNLIQSH
jgi:hypothetical protein